MDRSSVLIDSMTQQPNSRVRYVFDTKSSHFTVQAFAQGIAGIADHRPQFAVRSFSGEAEVKDGTLDGASLRLTVDLSSLVINDEVTEQDRRLIERTMFEEILQVSTYPNVTFTSSSITSTKILDNRFRVDAKGLVTLHGVSKQHSMEAQIVTGQDSLRVYGEFNLRQSDYGIALASVAGGLVRIKDEVKLVFFFVARKQG